MEQKLFLAVLLSFFAQAGIALSVEATDLLLCQAKSDAPAKSASAAAPAKTAAAAATTEPSGSAKPAETEAKATDDPNFTTPLNKGIALLNQNKTNEALVEFMKALEVNKNNTAVRNWIGYTYQKMGKFKEAAEVYEQVVQMDPDYVEAHNNLAFSYQNLQDYEKAEAEYNRALELKPGFTEARFNVACVMQLERKFPEALHEFENVLDAEPSRTDCYLHIGDIAREMKDYDKALTYYNKAMVEVKKAGNKNPQAMADILTDLCLIDKAKGDNAKCKEGLEKVLDLDPGSYQAQLTLGIIAYEEKDFNASLNFLAKALERNPYDAAVHFWLGRYYFSLDSLKNSIKQFSDCQRCDEVEKKFPECAEWLEKAKKKQAAL